MREILTNRAEIKKAISKFRSRLKNVASEKKKREWSFPSGNRHILETYSIKTAAGVLLVGIQSMWNTRVPHIFCLEREGRALSPDVEVNIPLGLDRSVSGAYLKDQKDVWLCSRGDFTSFRGKIKREVAFNYFEKWLVGVSDDEKETQVIPIASISSPTIVDDIVQFVKTIIGLKEDFKQYGDDAGTRSTWKEGREFEGKKSGGSGGPAESYEYLHGPLCNRLTDWLNSWNANKSFHIKHNSNIDVAIVKSEKALAIFEVKTDASLSSQLYTAVGQLFYYKHKYGSDKCALFLVLPENVIRQFNAKKFIESLGITTIVEKNSGFETIDGKKLTKILNKLKNK